MYHYQFTFKHLSHDEDEPLYCEFQIGVVAKDFASACKVFSCGYYGAEVLKVIRTNEVSSPNMTLKEEW